MSGFLNSIWIPIKALLFGASITLQPSSAFLTQHPQVFIAPRSYKLSAINNLAALHLRTNALSRMTMSQLIEGNMNEIANNLYLTSIDAFLVKDGKTICQLRFSGFGISKTSKEAIYRCEDSDISGMQFSEIVMRARHPVRVTSVVWQNVGK